MIGRPGLALLALTLGAIKPLVAIGAEAGGASPASAMGVKHLLKGSLTVAREVGASTESDQLRSDLRVTVRISDHAPDASFFGYVVTHFSTLGSGQQAPLRTIWEDAQCHRDRGLPKVTVTKIEGTVSDGDTRTKISAAMRRIGKLVPLDEIIVTKRLTPPLATHAGLAMRAVTAASRLVFDVELSTLRCSL